MATYQLCAMNTKRSLCQNGFTLIEVMVALTIVAIALGALISSSGSQATQAGYLKQKTIAHWVALNEITRLQISKEWPDLGNTDGSTQMANNEWFWVRTVTKTEDEKSHEVEFVIFSDKDRKHNLTSLVAYLIK